MPKPTSTSEGTLLGCPDCSGVLSLVKDADSQHLHFECSIGHKYALPTLLEAKENQLETALWSVVSLLEHIERICEYFLKGIDGTHLKLDHRVLRDRCQRAQAHGGMIRKIIEDSQPADLGQELHEPKPGRA